VFNLDDVVKQAIRFARGAARLVAGLLSTNVRTENTGHYMQTGYLIGELQSQEDNATGRFKNILNSVSEKIWGCQSACGTGFIHLVIYN